MCESSYVASAPEGPVPTFEVTEHHKAVIVIDGEVRCIGTREHFIAPCVIPKTVKHLLMNIGKPKLLVITTEASGTLTTPAPTDMERGPRRQAGMKARLLGYLWSALTWLKTSCLPKFRRGRRIHPETNSDTREMVEIEAGMDTLAASTEQERVFTPVSHSWQEAGDNGEVALSVEDHKGDAHQGETALHKNDEENGV